MAQRLTEENLEAQVDAAMETARNAPDRPSLVDATYHRDLDLFVLKVSDGRRLALPRENLQHVAAVTPEQAAQFVIGPFRNDLWWPSWMRGSRSLRGAPGTPNGWRSCAGWK
jgi:hypothetical protein